MNQRTYNSALLFGVTAGLRSMAAPASLALAQQQPGAARNWLLASPRTARVLTMLALGELIFDKLPLAPKRIAPGPLSARLLVGGICGAAASKDQASGALLGIAGALAGSFAGYAIRKGVEQASGTPDALVGLAEDGLAIGMGMLAASLQMEDEEEAEFQARRAEVA